MGMSASQVRLLTVTKRIHEVENEAQRIQNQKMLLGLESDEAYEEYLAAMEQKNIEYAYFDPNQGNFDWAQLNTEKLFQAGYHLKVRNLANVKPITVNFTSVGDGQTPETFTYSASIGSTPLNLNLLSGPDQYPTSITFSYGSPAATYTMAPAQNGAVVATTQSSAEWIECTSPEEVYAVLGTSAGAIEDPEQFLRELVYNAYAIIMSEQLADDGVSYEFKETHIATNVGLRERDDDTRIAKAEAEYEAALRRIDKKEEKYDADLAKMDQERSALTTQLETFKTCIKDNIERTFKIFS